MSLGQHRIGRMFMNLRMSIYSGLGGLQRNTSHTLPNCKPYTGIDGESLPHAPKNPYRKRPVKLIYDKNDYHMFRLPSEKAFLLGGMDHNELFGARKGIDHSPHIR